MCKRRVHLGRVRLLQRKEIFDLTEIANDVYSATVSGSSSEPYLVELYINHPRKSKCNCLHADGKRIICKHIVAVYFTVFPSEAERFYAEAMAYQGRAPRKKEKVLRIYKNGGKATVSCAFSAVFYCLTTIQRKMVVAIFRRFYYHLPPFCIFQIVADRLRAILIVRNRPDSSIF